MRILLLTLFISSLMVSCNTNQSHSFKEGDIISKVKLDDSGRVFSVSLINNTSIDTYLTNICTFNIKIYKLDSNGKYIDWTDSFSNNIFPLWHYIDTTYIDTTYFDDSGIHKISHSSSSKLRNEYLTRMNIRDSLEKLSALNFLDWNLWCLTFIKKGRTFEEKIDLYPLILSKGSFKIFYYNTPKKYLWNDSFFLELPDKIDNYYIFNNKIKSDTIFISYE